MNNTDITVRTQLTACKLGELIYDYVNGRKYGKRNLAKLRLNLILLDIYVNILCQYDINSENNCFTEDEIKDIVDKISTLTGICFQPYGYSYKG